MTSSVREGDPGYLPDVSVVMPVWRPQSDWLEHAVASVLAEVGCRIELILVDDGNAEPVAGMLDIVDPRVRILRLAHGGVSRARNAGIAAAGGSYVRFVDADDAIEPGSTARLLSLTAGATDIISYGATCFCDEQLEGLWVLSSNVQGDAALKCLLGRFTVRLPSMLFPRAVSEKAGPWDPSLTVSEDWEWILRTLEHARVTGDATVVTRYRRAGGGATSDAQAGQRGARVVVQRWLDRHPEHRGAPIERQARGMLAAMAVRVHLSRGDLRAGLRALARAVARDPRALAAEAREALPAVRGLMAARLRPPCERRRRGARAEGRPRRRHG